MINVDREGNYLDIKGQSEFDPYSGEPRYAQQLNAKTKAQSPHDPYPEHSSRIFETILSDQQIKEIILFIHGGLFTRSTNFTWAISRFPPSLRPRVHVKLFGYPDKSHKREKCWPQRHGDFDNCPFWDRVFWWK